MMTRCSGMRLNLNFGVRCTSLGPDPDVTRTTDVGNNSTTIFSLEQGKEFFLESKEFFFFFEGAQVSVLVQLVR